MLNARGIACAVLVPLLWGVVPIYISVLGNADSLEIVVHRALSSMLRQEGVPTPQSMPSR
jgi:EamA domain-containing membrane protein RarD